MQLSMMLAFMGISSGVMVLISLMLLRQGGPAVRSARKLYGRNWGIALLLLAQGLLFGLVHLLNKTGCLSHDPKGACAVLMLYILVVAYAQPLLFYATRKLLGVAAALTLLIVRFLHLVFKTLMAAICSCMSALKKFATYLLGVLLTGPAEEVYGFQFPRDFTLWALVFLITCIPAIMQLIAAPWYSWLSPLLPPAYLFAPLLITILRRPCCAAPNEVISARREYEL